MNLFSEDFGQKVDLTQRIRDVLTNYPEGTTILKELIQNADDAGASKVVFCLDKRTHGTSSLAFEPMAQFQGPSLLVHNNAQFTDDDFESISRIGGSGKRGKAWKTGRFGIGFNSVYHLTDLPSFVSGKYVVYFDPHTSYLPNTSSVNPGKRIDFVTTGALSAAPDQFSPFIAFGCNMRDEYGGTLFRFPLRTPEQAALSRLSHQSFSCDDMTQLFRDFEEEAEFSILFLRNVESVEMYEWSPELAGQGPQQEPTLCFSCKISSPDADLRSHRRAYLRLAKQAADPSSGATTACDVYRVAFESHFARGQSGATLRQLKHTFMVCQSMGTPGSPIGKLVTAGRHFDLNLTPWAAVAAQVDCLGAQGSGQEDPVQGRAFCFLPLPVRTLLPVHVNGFFELSSNRRDIWFGDDMDRAGKMRSDWNRCLLEDVAAPSYATLLQEAVKCELRKPHLLPLLPGGDLELVPPWKGLVTRMLQLLSASPVLYSKSSAGMRYLLEEGSWVSPSAALYHDEESSTREELEALLVRAGCPVVRLPEGVKQMLLRHSVAAPQAVVPSYVRWLLSRQAGLVVSLAEALVVLEYCLTDLLDEEVESAMSGLRLLPLANKQLASFGRSLSQDVLLLVSSDYEYALLKAGAAALLVDRDMMKPELYNRLKSIAVCSPGGRLQLLSDSLLCFLMHHFLPAEWKGVDCIAVDPASPLLDWLRMLWKHLSRQGSELGLFEAWPLLPTEPCSLARLDPRQPRAIQGHAGQWAGSDDKAGLLRLLSDLGCHVVRADFECGQHPQLQSYILPCTVTGVLTALHSLCQHTKASQGGTLEALTPQQRRLLRTFLLKPESRAEFSSLPTWLKPTLKSLPLFELHCSAEFVPVSGPARLLLPPPDMDPHLLTEDFLSCSDHEEALFMSQHLGVTMLSRVGFYRRQVLTRLPSLPPAVRDRAMTAILQELPQLCAADAGVLDILRHLPFVPASDASSTDLQRANQLYDPRVPELRFLLRDPGCFPGGVFAEASLLDMLHSLGLNTEVSDHTLLRCARDVHALHESRAADAQLEALQRGKVLLAYLELNAAKWMGPASNLGLETGSTLGFMVNTVSSLLQGQSTDKVDASARLWEELRSLCWCPVLTEPPAPHMPWPDTIQRLPSTASPRVVCLPANAWLVSASMRVLDGECRSDVLRAQLGWSQPPAGSVLATQLLELGRTLEGSASLLEEQSGAESGDSEDSAKLKQVLAEVVPQLYSALSRKRGTPEWELVQALLQGDSDKWVWMGDCFCAAQECVFQGPLNLSPFLRVVPTDMVGFRDLLLDLGVRESASFRDHLLVLQRMAACYGDRPLEGRHLEAAVWLVQHLSDADHAHLAPAPPAILCPDAAGVLAPAPDLVFNDAPWVSGAEPAGLPGFTARYVHSLISSDVAEKVGARSLRRLMLADSAASIDLGLHSSAEAFGQHEVLTTRLKHIVDMYADGPGVLCELLQNADDAAASEVRFVVDLSSHAGSSVLGPRMADWQGAALYAYNDAVFTQRDLQAISRIGQAGKLDRPSAIGRFGLGFNSVYHFTDLPSFVSGSTLVFFDPHACNLPGVSPSHPGLKIAFAGRGLARQFPDQFQPYMLFGCDMEAPFPGTLFRFPLRTEATAARSDVKREVSTGRQLLELCEAFRRDAEACVLFLRNVCSISFFVKSSASAPLEPLFVVSKAVQPHGLRLAAAAAGPGELDPVHRFVQGDPDQPLSKDAFYTRLRRLPAGQLPWSVRTVRVTVGSRSSVWAVCLTLGGGAARNMAVAPENRCHGFVPLAAVAALLASSEEDQEGGSAAGGEGLPVAGRAFCFLPLPIHTGLPVHVNAYFELSSNRRDIWQGQDLSGSGKVRSEWNLALIRDALAPAYARLLAECVPASAPPPSAAQGHDLSPFFSLWPLPGSLQEPWSGLCQSVYRQLVSAGRPCLFSPVRDGLWLPPSGALLPDTAYSAAKRGPLQAAVLRVGLPLASPIPDAVAAVFQPMAGLSVPFLSPAHLRGELRDPGALSHVSMEDAALLLAYCLTDVTALVAEEAGADADSRQQEAAAELKGLKLVPMCDCSLGSLEASASEEGALIVTQEPEFELLWARVPGALVDMRLCDSDLRAALAVLARSRASNVRLLSTPTLALLMPRLFPPSWKGLDSVQWPWDEQGLPLPSSSELAAPTQRLPQRAGSPSPPTLQWFQGFWSMLGSLCREGTDLSMFAAWPILPTRAGKLVRLAGTGCPVLEDGSWSDSLLDLFGSAGVAVVHSAHMVRSVPPLLLRPYLHAATAAGVLDAFKAAAGARQPQPRAAARPSAAAEQGMVPPQLRPGFWVCLFAGASDAQRTELRSFFLQRRWLQGPGRLDSARLACLKCLPIFEAHAPPAEDGSRMFVNLVTRPCYLAPAGVDQQLLTPQFIRADSPAEAELLELLAVKTLSKTAFYLDIALPAYTSLSDSARACCTLAVLGEIAESSSPGSRNELVEVLQVLPCIQNGKGEFFPPHSLYSPHVPELLALLDRESYFPAPALCSPRLLPALSLLGLSDTLGLQGILDCARSVGKALSLPDNKEESVRRAQALVAFLDEQPQSAAIYGDGLEPFWEELRGIAWCPVVTAPPHPLLPWCNSLQPPIVIDKPDNVRPMPQMWQASKTKCLLDAPVQSQRLQELLGWTDALPVIALVQQLAEMSRLHRRWERECRMSGADDGPDAPAVPGLLERRAGHGLMSEEVPRLIACLSERLTSTRVTPTERRVMASSLSDSPCLWVGDRFVEPKQMALSPSAVFPPYLLAVPASLAAHVPALLCLGVMPTFRVESFVKALRLLAADSNGPLSPDQLTLCLRLLQALGEVLTADSESGRARSAVPLLIPDSNRVMRPANDLVYNDATWLENATADSVLGVRGLVHPLVPAELAALLGAKSMRYMSLVDQEMTRSLPCVHSAELKQRLQLAGGGDAVLYDLLEVAELAGAREAHIVLDKRQYACQSLLQPNLAPFQGPALLLHLPSVSLSEEQVLSFLGHPAASGPAFQDVNSPHRQCQYGEGLRAAFHACDLLFVATLYTLFVFDPMGAVLVDAAAGSAAGVGKAYNLQGTDVAQRFSDQFSPLTLLPTAGSDRGTVIRMPLAACQGDSTASGAGGLDGPPDLERLGVLLEGLKSQLPPAMLFLNSLQKVSVSVWEAEQEAEKARPCLTWSVAVDPTKAMLRNKFPEEKKWRRFPMSKIFGHSVATSVQWMDLVITEGLPAPARSVTERWIVSQAAGSGRSRDLAQNRRYLQYKLPPVGSVATRVLRNGVPCLAVPPLASSSSCGLAMGAPFPLSSPGCQPFFMAANFLVIRQEGRRVFPTTTSSSSPPNEEPALLEGVGDNSISMPAEEAADSLFAMLAVLWNEEMLACVKDALLELMMELSKSQQQFVPLAVQSGLYSLWPRSPPADSAQGQDPDVEAVSKWVTKPFYVRMAQQPVWRVYGGEPVKLSEGMFLTPPGGAGVSSSVPPPLHAVGDFLKRHHRVLNVPWELSLQLRQAGVRVKELTPSMMRSLFKSVQVASSVGSTRSLVDMLEYCCADVILDSSPPVPASQPGNAGLGPDLAEAVAAVSEGDPLAAIGTLLSAGTRLVQEVHQQLLPDAGGEHGEQPIAPQLNQSALRELRGVLVPASDADRLTALGLGPSPLVVASTVQLSLIQNCAHLALHPLCLQRPSLQPIWAHPEVQRALNLSPFSARLLASLLRSLLPPGWDALASAWVAWNPPLSSPRALPSVPWLTTLWMSVDVASNLPLFDPWPLIPATLTTAWASPAALPAALESKNNTVLVQIRHRALVFLPPLPATASRTPVESEAGEQTVEEAADEIDAAQGVPDAVLQRYESLQASHPWLLPVLAKLGVPVLHSGFAHTPVAQLLESSGTRPPALSLLVLQKLIACKQVRGDQFGSSDGLSPEECSLLWQMMCAEVCSRTNLLVTPEEASVLQCLPIHRSVTGELVQARPGSHYFVGPTAPYQPREPECLVHQESGQGADASRIFYIALHITELTDEEVLLKLSVPRFSSLGLATQGTQLDYILRHWESLQLNVDLVTLLAATQFVQPGLPDWDDAEAASVAGAGLVTPSALLDPSVPLLAHVFADKPEVFPSARFSGQWLPVLRTLGLRSAVNARLLWECAQHLEQRAVQEQEQAQEPFLAVSEQLWRVGESLTRAVVCDVPLLMGSQYMERMKTARVVPCVFGVPCPRESSVGPGSTALRTLSSFKELLLLRDWPLGWTAAPVLVHAALQPSEAVRRSLHVRSPPMSTVLAHLQNIARDGGQSLLLRWPNWPGALSVDSTFDYVLNHLNSQLPSLSDSDKACLSDLSFVPVSNATLLVSPRSLFLRLPLPLAPLAFELPSALTPFAAMLLELGMRDSPSVMDLLHLLFACNERASRALNPNQLKAVLNILTLLHQLGSSGSENASLLHSAVVPDLSARLMPARSCQFLDPAGASVLTRIDSSRLHLAHPALLEQMCASFGVPCLSGVVLECLDSAPALHTVQVLAGVHVDSVKRALASPSFVEAVCVLMEECSGPHSIRFDSASGPRLGPSRSLVAGKIAGMADRLQFVASLATRFLLLPSRKDVTKRGGSGLHPVCFFVDSGLGAVYISEPPAGVLLASVLAAALSRCLGSPSLLPLADLFLSHLSAGADSPASPAGLLAAVGAGGRERAYSLLLAAAARGLPGQPVAQDDANMLHCLPLRPFAAGEVVVWPDSSVSSTSAGARAGQTLRYARVLTSCRPPPGQPVYEVQVESGPGVHRTLLSSDLLSFSTTAPVNPFRGTPPPAALDAASPTAAATEPAPADSLLPAASTATAARSSVSAAEVAGVVRDMLEVAGLPLGLEQQALLERVLSLQEKLDRSLVSLAAHERRSTELEAEAEEMRSSWLCKICQSEPVKYALLRCGHLLCEDCVSRVSRRCPFCRSPVSSNQRLYHA